MNNVDFESFFRDLRVRLLVIESACFGVECAVKEGNKMMTTEAIGFLTNQTLDILNEFEKNFNDIKCYEK